MGKAVDTIPSILNKCLFVSPDELTDGWTDNVKTVYPPTNTVCGGYNDYFLDENI